VRAFGKSNLFLPWQRVHPLLFLVTGEWVGDGLYLMVCVVVCAPARRPLLVCPHSSGWVSLVIRFLEAKNLVWWLIGVVRQLSVFFVFFVVSVGGVWCSGFFFFFFFGVGFLVSGHQFLSRLRLGPRYGLMSCRGVSSSFLGSFVCPCHHLCNTNFLFVFDYGRVNKCRASTPSDFLPPPPFSSPTHTNPYWCLEFRRLPLTPFPHQTSPPPPPDFPHRPCLFPNPPLSPLRLLDSGARGKRPGSTCPPRPQVFPLPAIHVTQTL